MSWLHAVIDVPGRLHASTGAFWSQVLGWPVGRAWTGHGELRSFEPPVGEAYVHLQTADGPPRVHVDVESSDARATIAAAVAAGAEVLHRTERWVTLRSPGGLPFCVLSARSRTLPDPVAWPDGHRSRLVQVCVDSPSSAHDAEVAFWRGLLPGRWQDSAVPEFAGKWHDDSGSPIQLLFQRLEEPLGPVRAHLDLGTDDVEADVRRVLGLGAEDTGRARGGGWHVLRDPAGLAFCITANAPDRTGRRDLG